MTNWSKNEVKLLIDNIDKSDKEIHKIFFPNRTLPSVRRKRQELGFRRPKIWNDYEINYLKKKYGKVNALIIARKLNKSIFQVYSKAEGMGLKCKKNIIIHPNKLWYNKEQDKILKKYGYLKSYEIKEKYHGLFYDKSLCSIRKRARKLGIKCLNSGNSGKRNGMFGKKHSKKIVEWNRKHKLKLWQNSEYAKRMYKSFKLKPTKPERIISQICKLNKLPFNYVGDGKVIINGFCPDFLSKNPKHIIEVNGYYWHSSQQAKKKDKRKLKCYKKLGYKTFIIWEKEIYRNPQKITERIIDFLYP